MTSPGDKQSRSLTLLKGTSLATISRGEGLVARMVQDAIDLARGSISPLSNERFRIGSFALREPDYRQVIRWAMGLKRSPEEVLDTLSSLRCKRIVNIFGSQYEACSLRSFARGDELHLEFGFRIEDGSIIDMVWDGEALPLESFQWEPGLTIRKLALVNRMPKWPATEVLRSLLFLSVENVKAVELDLSPVPELELLDCSRNELSEINLSPVPKLRQLDCSSNQVAKLDLSPVPRLIKLWCVGNQISELDLLPVPRLELLNCCGNKLTELKLLPVQELSGLDCGANCLTKLDLSPVADLTRLLCNGNLLGELDLSPVSGLQQLDCSVNQLTELDLSPVPKLTSLICYSNEQHRNHQITYLDLSSVPKLTRLNFSGNPLIKLDLSPVTKLKHLDCGYSHLSSLDLLPVPELERLECGGNPLSELNLTPVPRLSSLSCRKCELAIVDLGCLSNPNIDVKCDAGVRILRSPRT